LKASSICQPQQDQWTYHSLPNPYIFMRYRHSAAGMAAIAGLAPRAIAGRTEPAEPAPDATSQGAEDT
jgi:hypothetical protein